MSKKLQFKNFYHDSEVASFEGASVNDIIDKISPHVELKLLLEDISEVTFLHFIHIKTCHDLQTNPYLKGYKKFFNFSSSQSQKLCIITTIKRASEREDKISYLSFGSKFMFFALTTSIV